MKNNKFKKEIEIYLDYVNNYLTVSYMAQKYKLPQKLMYEKITAGKYALNEIIHRREEIREEIRKECISYGEIAELQEMKKYIPPNDIELLQWIETN